MSIATTKRKVADPRRQAVRQPRSGLVPADTLRVIRQLDAGFSFTRLMHFQKATGLPLGEVADLIGIPPRTLVRRRAENKLRPDESERLLRIARVFERAVDLFEGDAMAALRWLQTPNEEFYGHEPLEFSRTEIGARAVENEIGRIEHGVFS